ncbi:SH3 domain-containing protein [Rhodobacteraceae bacterium SC52]|nr:SH3 domain-containing protein [Rhodobacteraceae bacterium SC52]
MTMSILRRAGLSGLILAAVLAAACGTAQSVPTDTSETKQAIGPSTGLPMPRFVSIKASEANVRRGPSTTHRIDWVFQHPGLPVIVTGEYGHWRRVVDRDGLGGWVHYALLSGNRTVIVDLDMLSIRRKPERNAEVVAQLERGVIARLVECVDDWCEIRADGYEGWAESAALWGVELR